MYKRFKAVSQDPECEKFNVALVNEDISKWTVFMSSFCFLDDYSQLFKQLEKYEHVSGHPGGVTFEISFPMEFPSEPPFVRVISPRFCYRTGHVTIGGSICSPLLTSEKWSSSIDISQILLYMHSTLIDGQAVVDFTSALAFVPYSETEARANFVRTARDHNWKVSSASFTNSSGL